MGVTTVKHLNMHQRFLETYIFQCEYCYITDKLFHVSGPLRGAGQVFSGGEQLPTESPAVTMYKPE